VVKGHTSCVNIWVCSKHFEVSNTCYTTHIVSIILSHSSSSVKMGIRLCYKWDEPNEMVKVVKCLGLQSNYLMEALLAAQKLD